jgi:hypothetical protein
MRITTLLASSILALAATSAAAAPRCQERAVTWVTALEGVFVELEGVAQGDYDELELSTKLTGSKTTPEGVVETFHVDSAHTNEDEESWTVSYEVKLLSTGDTGCYVKSYKLIGIK